MPDLTCIHATAGLCPECQADYDADSSAYWEYGDYPAGEARWQALQAEIAADAARPARAADVTDGEIPF